MRTTVNHLKLHVLKFQVFWPYYDFNNINTILIINYFRNSDVRLPATRNFLIIIIVLLFMGISYSLDRWAVLSPDRIAIRMVAVRVGRF